MSKARVQNIYKIKDSIDIYEIPIDDEFVKIQFYKINTRDKLTIKIDFQFSKILSKIDGINSLSEIIASYNLSYKKEEADDLFDFLINEGIVTVVSDENSLFKSLDIERYSRQINYFDDLMPSQLGVYTQYQLENKKIVIFGVGAVGSSICIHLVRSGVKNVTLVDYRRLDRSSILRHLYANNDSVGQLKTLALKEYLKKINPDCQVEVFNEKLIPETDLSILIPESTSIVINTADEPYIGHTTIKLGRYLWDKKIALYVSGGFDAHLMSTGELISRDLTPCADCCANTFKKALSTWKPTYPDALPISMLQEKNKKILTSTTNIGGAGGISSQSLFSSSYAAINIINFLIGSYKDNENFVKRGEYLINSGKMTWVTLENQKGCTICG